MNPSLSALVVMGVAGCGKSSIGAAIAAHSGGRLIEGDAFHPAENIRKMSAGIPWTTTTAPAGWYAWARSCKPPSPQANGPS